MKMGYKRNKLQQLKLFCAIIEEGTIIKAAEKMNTAQPNVSLQIKSLEKALNVVLFKREKQRLLPTEEALRYYKMCKKSIEEIDFLLGNAIDAIKEDCDNLIKIAAHSYMLSHILPPYFKQIIDINPNVKFDLHNLNYTEAMDMLKAGTVDFAILPIELGGLPKYIEIKEFYRCEAAVTMSKDHPLAKIEDKDITWEVISQYDYITLGSGVTAQGLKSAIKDNSLNSRFHLNNGSWEICMGAVKAGMAISGADRDYFSWQRDIVFKECSNLLPVYQFYILINKKVTISNASKQLLKLMQP